MSPDHDNPIIWYFDVYFSLFLIKDPLPLPLFMKLPNNTTSPPSPPTPSHPRAHAPRLPLLPLAPPCEDSVGGEVELGFDGCYCLHHQWMKKDK
jgi:hypothetical protein